jgi:hypothetical protein
VHICAGLASDPALAVLVAFTADPGRAATLQLSEQDD